MLHLARAAPLDYQRDTSRLSEEHLQFDFIEYGFVLDAQQGWWGGTPIVSIDWAFAKLEPAFRHQLLQSHVAFTLLARKEQEWLTLCAETLEALEKRGYSAASNWLEENYERIYGQFDNWEGWLSEQERDYIKEGWL